MRAAGLSSVLPARGISPEAIRAALSKLLSYPAITEFLADKGIAKETFLARVIDTKLPPGLFIVGTQKVTRTGMTIELAREIVEERHDYNWKGDSYCIYFLSQSHTFCSVSAQGRVCPGCADKLKAKEVAAITYDGLEKYRLHKLQASLSAARTKMRQVNEPTKRLRDKEAAPGVSSLLLPYQHMRDHVYHSRLKVVLRPYNNWYNTVGVDEQNNGQLRKLTMSDLELLRGITTIEPMLASLDEEAHKYVVRNNPRASEVW